MRNVQFRWSKKGFEDVRRRPETMKALDRIGYDLAATAGEGYVYSPMQGRPGIRPPWDKGGTGKGMQGRYRGIVYAKGMRWAMSNAKHNTLVKVIGAAGGRTFDYR